MNKTPLETRTYEAFFDGACEPSNPDGAMGIGAIIYCNHAPVMSRAVFEPAQLGNTNNIAEYRALISILDYILVGGIGDKNKYKNILIIKGDSQMVIKQMKGEWRVKTGGYVPYANLARRTLETLREKGIEVILKWIPRDENARADELSKQALIENHVGVAPSRKEKNRMDYSGIKRACVAFAKQWCDDRHTVPPRPEDFDKWVIDDGSNLLKEYNVRREAYGAEPIGKPSTLTPSGNPNQLKPHNPEETFEGNAG